MAENPKNSSGREAIDLVEQRSDFEATLRELERLEREATKGPWDYLPEDRSSVPGESYGAEIYGPQREDVATCGFDEGGVARTEDAVLIVALRNAAPALFAEVRRLREIEVNHRKLTDWVSRQPCANGAGFIAEVGPNGVPIILPANCGSCPPCQERKHRAALAAKEDE